MSEREFEEVEDEDENQLEMDMVAELMLGENVEEKDEEMSFESSISDYGEYDLNEGMIDEDINNNQNMKVKSMTEDELEPLTAGILSKFKQYRNLLAWVHILWYHKFKINLYLLNNQKHF